MRSALVTASVPSSFRFEFYWALKLSSYCWCTRAIAGVVVAPRNPIHTNRLPTKAAPIICKKHCFLQELAYNWGIFRGVAACPDIQRFIFPLMLCPLLKTRVSNPKSVNLNASVYLNYTNSKQKLPDSFRNGRLFYRYYPEHGYRSVRHLPSLSGTHGSLLPRNFCRTNCRIIS